MCLVIGDSIAVGIELPCKHYAQKGITSAGWLKKYHHVKLKGELVIVSLGSNDDNPDDLEKVKAKLGTAIWVLPACNVKFCKPAINAKIKRLNYIVPKSRQADGIHPTPEAYRDLSARLLRWNRRPYTS